jgi:hypothetical protein
MYLTGYMLVCAIVNFMFSCAYRAIGNNKLAIATGVTTAGSFLAAIVSLVAFPS